MSTWLWVGPVVGILVRSLLVTFIAVLAVLLSDEKRAQRAERVLHVLLRRRRIQQVLVLKLRHRGARCSVLFLNLLLAGRGPFRLSGREGLPLGEQSPWPVAERLIGRDGHELSQTKQPVRAAPDRPLHSEGRHSGGRCPACVRKRIGDWRGRARPSQLKTVATASESWFSTSRESCTEPVNERKP